MVLEFECIRMYDIILMFFFQTLQFLDVELRQSFQVIRQKIGYN